MGSGHVRMRNDNKVLRLTLVMAIVTGSVGNLGAETAGEPAHARCADCNVVVISVDTLRADFLPVYGDRKTSAPEIEEFAESSLTYEEAYSSACTTAESHMSMMTGHLPSVHRIVNNHGAGFEDAPKLSREIPVLAEALKQAGYATAGFHGNPNVAAELGFGRGFDSYLYRDIAWQWGAKRSILEWIKAHRDRKFFLFVHTNNVHAPYLPEPERLPPSVSEARRKELLAFSEQLRQGNWNDVHRRFFSYFEPITPSSLNDLKAYYRGVIAETSRDFSDVLTALEPVRERTIVVFTADHGEEFMEHGKLQHTQHFRETLRVPLLVRVPNVAATRLSMRVTTRQLAPTLLHLVGRPPLMETDVRMLPLQDGVGSNRRAEEIPLFSVTPTWNLSTVIDGRFKLHVTLRIGEAECPGFKREGHERTLWNARLPRDPMSKCVNLSLFDIVSDPQERIPLEDDDTKKRLYGTLWEKLEADWKIWGRQAPAGKASSSTPPEVIRQLKSLGYIQ